MHFTLYGGVSDGLLLVRESATESRLHLPRALQQPRWIGVVSWMPDHRCIHLAPSPGNKSFDAHCISDSPASSVALMERRGQHTRFEDR